MAALDDRVALVTGSSSGLGFAAAQALAGLGARVALNSRGGEKLEAAYRSLAAGSGEVVAMPAASYITGQALAVEGGYLKGMP